MASKRKKSRPTRITEEDVSKIAERPQASSYNAEDTLTQIQRYIEEGSEDTPDCLEKKLDLSGESNIECVSPVPDIKYETAPTEDDSRDGEESFPRIFVNGHIPYNLKFHQLMKDECERVTEDFTIPETMSAFYNSDELLSFRQALPDKKLSRKRSRPIEDETPRYSCTMCKYVTNRSDHYKRHLMTHSADKPLKCTLCSYGTGRSDHYKRHLQRHGMSEDEIIATCFRNGLKLKNVAPVGQPLEIENQLDKSKENLDKANSISATLIPPIRQVESNVVFRVEKKFKCNQCSYSTNKSSHLTRHQNTHSKSYLSHCDKCNKSFRTPYTRKDHNCNGRQSHKCPKCTKIYADRKTMMRHLVDKHNTTVDMVPVTASIPQNLSVQNYNTVANEARMQSYYSTDTVFSPTRNGVDLRLHHMTTSPYTSNYDDIQDYKPMDLTVASRRENGNALSNLTDMKIRSVIPKISNDGLRSVDVLPDVPSDHGNLGCTRCGEWFNKLNEYSTHTCVS